MDTMKGIVLKESKPQLRTDLPIPPIKAGEVRVKIIYSTVNGHEIELASNNMMQLLNKIMGARGDVKTGLEFSGIVQSDGQTFKTGDHVIGYIDLSKGWRPHAEYISIPEKYLAHLPESISFGEAAAVPMSAMTALVALRDIGNIKANDSVLILGASGGVGVMAVQIARILGANITAVASGKHHYMLQELGADTLIDYKTTDITQTNGQYDLILDMTATYQFKQLRHLLKNDGDFIPADPFNSLFDLLRYRNTVRWLLVDKGDTQMLTELAEWMVSGQLKSIIDSEFELSDYEEAFSKALSRGKPGRILLKFGDD